MKVVIQKRFTQGILIYAVGKLFEELKKKDGLTVVEGALGHKVLTQMDTRISQDPSYTQVYPIYLANDKYGMRGLDYRAKKNPHGVYLLVCSPFSNYMNRKQGLMRVGRYGDNCHRIVNSKMDEELVKNQVDI